MFSGGVVWRGIIYTILMLLGKAVCGLWLARLPVPPIKDNFSSFWANMVSGLRALVRRWIPLRNVFWNRHGKNGQGKEEQQQSNTNTTSTTTAPAAGPLQEHPRLSTGPEAVKNKIKNEKTPGKPLSLYPAGIMSCAMIARGEIGFLISSVAEANGIFQNSSKESDGDASSDIFLIITWAIVLCTIIGPLCVGLLVRRVKKLEAAHAAAVQVDGSRKDVLGVWGVS
jgi:hypothetical protein